MGRRIHSRSSNGRFRPATLANTFGMDAPVCPSCRRFNPYNLGDVKPTNCHACGSPLEPANPEGPAVTDNAAAEQEQFNSWVIDQ
jgi:hypothetical protein